MGFVVDKIEITVEGICVYLHFLCKWYRWYVSGGRGGGMWRVLLICHFHSSLLGIREDMLLYSALQSAHTFAMRPKKLLKKMTMHPCHRPSEKIQISDGGIVITVEREPRNKSHARTIRRREQALFWGSPSYSGIRCRCRGRPVIEPYNILTQTKGFCTHSIHTPIQTIA